MKNIIFLLVFTFVSYSLIAQNTYYKKDSVTKAGVNIIFYDDETNAKYCPIGYETREDKLTPNDIDEYYVMKRTFFAKDVLYRGQKKRVFLELLNTGKINLYYYAGPQGKTFYFEKDNGDLVEIPKNNEQGSYKKQIEALFQDFENMKEITPFVGYYRKSIQRAFSYYNNEKTGFIPKRTFGGYFSRLSVKNQTTRKMFNLIGYNYKYESGYSGGIYTNIPFNLSKSSLHAEFNVSYFSYLYKTTTISLNNFSIQLPAYLTLSVKNYAFNFPVLYNYQIPVYTASIFVQTGTVFTLNKTDKNKYYYDYYTTGDIEYLDDVIYDKFQLGWAAGGGIRIPVAKGINMIGEARYTINGLNNMETFYIHMVNVNVGLEF